MIINKEIYNKFATYSSGNERYLGIDSDGKLQTINNKTQFKILRRKAPNTSIKAIIEYAKVFFKNNVDQSNEIELGYLNEGLKTLRTKYQIKINTSLWHRFLSSLYSIFKWKTTAQTKLEDLNGLQSSVEDKIQALKKKKFFELIDLEKPINIEQQEIAAEASFLSQRSILEEQVSQRLQTLKLPAEHHLRTLLDPKMIGHVLGGFMIGDNEDLEGSNTADTLSYMLTFLDRLQEGEITKGFENFIQKEKLRDFQDEFLQGKEFADKMLALSKEMTKLREAEKSCFMTAGGRIETSWTALEAKKIGLTQDVITSLHSLPIGKSFLMTGGWSGSINKPGHAMLYRFTKENDRFLTLEIINTGSGLETHSQFIEGNKLKYEPVRRFEKVTLTDGELDLKMIQGFLDCKFLPNTTEEYEFSSADIYHSSILERIKHREVVWSGSPT